MAFAEFDLLRAEISDLGLARPVGRVAEVGRGTIEVSGLSECASLGDRAKIRCQSGREIGAEVLSLRLDMVTLLADGAVEGKQMRPNTAKRTPNGRIARLMRRDLWVGQSTRELYKSPRLNSSIP